MRFLDAYKGLDALCYDIYGPSAEKKLGVTLYLEAMDCRPEGAWRVPGWNSDYESLKRLRNLRNRMVHGSESFSSASCTEADVAFLVEFKSRILYGRDPLALLRKEVSKPSRTACSSDFPEIHPQPQQKSRSSSNPRSDGMGCASMLFLAVAAVILPVLLLVL